MWLKIFFFFKQKTAYDMRIGDWSSDVCSSDLAEWAAELPEDEDITVYWSGGDWLDMCRGPHLASTGKLDPQAFTLTRVSGAYWRGDQKNAKIGRASCRERVCQYV